MEVTVKIKHIPTGEIINFPDTFDYSTEWYNPIFIWEHGNYACDCNRHIFFHNFKEGEDINCSHDLYQVNIFDSENNCIYKEY